MIHFIQSHLDTNVRSLTFANESFVDNDVLQELTISENSSAIIKLNCYGTGISYNGIVKLWNSMSFGKLSSEYPTYEQYTGKPVVTIEIEVGNTKIIDQHKLNRFQYPLPLLRDFEITYGHKCIGEPYNTYGYKKIVLMNNGKELERNY